MSAAEQMADAEPAEVAADGPDEASAETTDDVSDVSAETTDEVSAEATEVTAEGTDDVTDEAPAEPEHVDPQPTRSLPRSEFQWTKLEFTPLEWRYDAEPETIDLREGAERRRRGRPGLRRPWTSGTRRCASSPGAARPVADRGPARCPARSPAPGARD